MFGQLSVFSQDFRRKAEESPLSTVFYLLSTTDKDSREREKACLAVSFSDINKVGESLKTAELFKDGGYSEDELILVVQNLIKNNKVKEANDFVSYLLKRLENDSYKLKHLWDFLIILNRGDEAKKIADGFDDSDKVDAYFLITESYLKHKNPQKALELIEHISPIVEKSKYGEDKAVIGLYYAKLGKESEALRFQQESTKNLNWKTGKPEYTEGRIIDKAVEIYRTLGKDKEANELLSRQGESEDVKSLVQIAESYFSKGNRVEATKVLEKSLELFDPTLDEGSFDLNGVISLYIRLDEIEKAENLTKSLIGNDYLQQIHLLKIADFHIKNKNNKKALETLNFALERTRKIDTSEEENGSLWTSGKWEQAKYQSQIIKRLIVMQFDKEALQLISQIQKPYLKASLLTEYVISNKKRLRAKDLSIRLKEAEALLKRQKNDIFDSRRYDVYAATARAFAEIGMPQKSTNSFAQSLDILSKEMIEDGTESGLLFAMCSIGVEFDKANIKANEQLKNSLRIIIKKWEDEEF